MKNFQDLLSRPYISTRGLEVAAGLPTNALADQYHYTDNWYGRIYSFTTLKDAKKAASKEQGAITIFKGREIVAVINP